MTRSFRFSFILTFLLPIALAFSLSGCLLLGLGAATVGGCALLDENEDDTVTEAELSEGLFDRWDADGDGELTEAEFDVGAESSGVFTEMSANFPAWDTNDDDRLTRDEFEAGISEEPEAEQWADARCDDLGL